MLGYPEKCCDLILFRLNFFTLDLFSLFLYLFIYYYYYFFNFLKSILTLHYQVSWLVLAVCNSPFHIIDIFCHAIVFHFFCHLLFLSQIGVWFSHIVLQSPWISALRLVSLDLLDELTWINIIWTLY